MTGSLINNIYQNSNPIQPEVGMGATVLMWSDRRAGTISRVSPSKKTLWFQSDKATRVDTNGMSDAQAYEYERQPDAPEAEYTLRKNGRWVRKGSPMKGSGSLLIGVRDEHYDYSF